MVGAIFDWDGVVIDSSGYHEESWQILARQEQKVLPANYFEKSFGKRNETIIPEVLQWTTDENEIQRIARLKEDIYRKIITERGLSPLPGVTAFLEMLLRDQVPCAIGSSTPRLNIITALRLLGFERYFQVIIGSEDVTRGKPDPQVFLLAAHELGISAKRCVVFEDALVGIEAAHGAGMKVVAVATTNPVAALKEADLVVHRLDELSTTILKQLCEVSGSPNVDD